MSGVEVVGITLAILPLVVGKITDYAEGLDKAKVIFSRRRYLRELRFHRVSIETQQVVLQDLFTKLLQDSISFEDEISKMLEDPDHVRWKDPEIDRNLRAQLGSNYQIFKRNMEDVNELLSELSQKLGMSSKTPLEDDTSILEGIKRIKQGFEFQVCEKLCSRLRNATDQLKSITEISNQHHQQNRKPKWKSKSFERHRCLRRRAKSIHKVMLHQNRWACICKKPHILNLELALPNEEQVDASNETFRFRCGIPTSDQLANSSTVWMWRNVETTAIMTVGKLSTPTRSISQQQKTSNKNGRVAFEDSSIKSSTTTLTANKITTSSNIKCLCSSLKAAAGVPQREPIGYLNDEEDSDVVHEAYVVQDSSTNHVLHTLADALACPSQTVQRLRDIPSVRLSTRNRLMIAAKLAYGTFQLHGNWLPQQWTTTDVVFIGQDLPNGPYVSWTMPQSSRTSTQGLASVKSHALVFSKTLYPLGLVLVQLALCKTLSELRQPEDENSDENITALSTALRVLSDVEDELGSQYFLVTQHCLKWNGQTDKGMDNDDFQRAVFDNVVKPLLDCFESFSQSRFG